MNRPHGNFIQVKKEECNERFNIAKWRERERIHQARKPCTTSWHFASYQALKGPSTSSFPMFGEQNNIQDKEIKTEGGRWRGGRESESLRKTKRGRAPTGHGSEILGINISGKKKKKKKKKLHLRIIAYGSHEPHALQQINCYTGMCGTSKQ